jgi:signal transduction histidine kinase
MILIVDDRQENVFSLNTVLQQHGFATDTAQSGEEALKKLLKTDYALIILDVQMPGMDGFEVAEAISSFNKTKDTPIIFLSAVNTHKKFITKGFESGAVEYLTKPIDPDILILKVRNFYRLYEKTVALKEAEKALTSTVHDLQKTLEALPQLAFTTNANGDLEYVNQQWLEFAPSRNEFPEIAPGSLQKRWKELISKGKSFETEVSVKSQNDGLFYYHLLRATPVTANGQITRWVGTLTSIHEQKMMNEILEHRVAERTRELLETNRELEISNNDLQQFTSVASHDLKEPLRKIQFFGNILSERAELSPDLSNYLKKIIRSSGRMSNLIDDLLSFASLSRPNLFQYTDTGKIIDEILNDLELVIEEKKAQVHVQPMPVMEVIPGLFRQLFQNLISNSLKFSQPGVAPHISITSELVDIPAVESPPKKNGAYCRITVSDNGIGFEEKYAEKIFTIFQRLNAASEYEGTGIGLAIAKKITDRHNGLIAARSIPGEGATFFIILPVKQDELHKAKEQQQLAVKGSF